MKSNAIKRIVTHDPPKPFTKRMSKPVTYDTLPFFVSTARLAQFTGRDIRTVRKWVKRGDLPPRVALAERNKGWMKDVIVAWLDQHPERMRNDQPSHSLR